jgi:hypothetical protein
MAAKKGSSSKTGGILVFLGSLVYLYVVFTWYSKGAALGAWLSASAFLGPLVVAFAMLSAIILFFTSVGMMADMAEGEKKHQMLWKFVMIGGITEIIVTGGSGWFYAAIVGFILTYLGALMASM